MLPATEEVHFAGAIGAGMLSPWVLAVAAPRSRSGGPGHDWTFSFTAHIYRWFAGQLNESYTDL